MTTAPDPRRPRPVSGDRTAAHPVLDAADVTRVLTRMAHEILEKNGGADDVVLLGIPTRGSTLAHRIAEQMASVEQRTVPVGSLDVTLYRDDLRLRGVRALGRTELPPGGVAAGSWCWSTTCCSPAGPGGPRWTPSATWAGRRTARRRPAPRSGRPHR